MPSILPQLHHVTWFLLVSVVLYSPCSVVSLTPEMVHWMWHGQQIPVTNVQSQNISKQCHEKLLMLNLNNSVKALDACGKPGAGILVGNINWLGHFDECDGLKDFHYCLVEFNISEVGEFQGIPIPMQYGLCAPQECSEIDVLNGLEYFTDGSKFPLRVVSIGSCVENIPGFSVEANSQPMCAKYPHEDFDAKFFAAVTIFGILFLLVVVSSLYHAWYHSQACHHKPVLNQLEENLGPSHPDTSPLMMSQGPEVHIQTGVPTDFEEKEDHSTSDGHIQVDSESKKLKTFNHIIFSWALPHNLPKLLSVHQTKGAIPCLNGIRVLSMLWVILGHTFWISAMVGTVNPETGVDWLKRYGFLFVLNAFYSVDTFFFLSGLLVTYLTLKQMKKKHGKIAWHWFYFHRYWRLSPVLAMTMLLYVCITPYFGHGPYAQNLGVREFCPKYWWANLLYISNFYPVYSAEMCMGWVWYLANDMQFYIISPLILVPLFFIPWLGLSLIAVLCAASMCTTGILVAVYDFPSAFSEFQTQPGTHATFTDVVYMKPYCRISPYLVGMILGCIFFKYPPKSIKFHWMVALLGWILACGTGYACVYSVYGNYNGEPWPTAGNVVYEMLCRFAWGLFVAWVVFACYYGYGGWVNSFLDHPAWAPLGRLTYSAYLLHPIVVFFFLAHQGSALYLSLGLMAFYFAGVSLISYGCAAIMSLMVEFPLVGLEKLFIPRG
ncbi:Nose resistant to fluoxetine protein 6 [Holothuria leucospilota]|uniref:Nose resistant to fluoxetine protein 6 n=1 Tax=Holothuria leucospilota TaxID=206669 RepID=A0A9Q1CC04_HOLLE|nr:Nose resistant to fluoxetine protein 6 [Holothuria leucospilota]